MLIIYVAHSIMASWRAFDSNLIDAVRLKTVLYNTRLKENKNIKMKENAWKAVAAELDSNGKHLFQCCICLCCLFYKRR